MGNGVFVIQPDGSLLEMTESVISNEADFQALLATYPNLIPGDQVDPAAPRKWLLVSREMGLPKEEDGGDHWSLDHLFLDQDGIPTLIEVKRGSDTRIRREVVGQMLDYAANAVVYLPVETIRARFEKECASRNESPSERLLQFIEGQGEPDVYWQAVKTNLQAGRVRLVFVSDAIPAELRRVVEFLNGQMDPAEVLAVELRQYESAGVKTVVPRVFGRTAEAEGKKASGTRSSRLWTEENFFRALEGQAGADSVAPARRILEWAKAVEQRGEGRVAWGTGARTGSFIIVLWDKDGTVEHFPVAVYTYGRLEIQFQYLKNKPPFASFEIRRELADRLRKIPGFLIPSEGIDKRPSTSLASLDRPEAMKVLLEVLEWVRMEASK